MARKRVTRKSRTTKLGPIKPIDLSSFSQQAMKTYGSYVLMDRAVADVRDGLKPVQRRILWSMHELKLQKGFKKSAKIVGDTMGNYHPHGDAAIYLTMVNMVGDRYPLVLGHGNFGSPTDNAASMRYTEARLSPLAELLFEDIDVAEFVSNYSDDRKEPLVLPSRLPLLLLNGSSGIGVGLRATLPPHNLRELIRCLVYYIRKDKPSLRAVTKNMPGPDYGYGVLLSSIQDVYQLYLTGKGTLRYRCEYRFEEDGSTPLLVVTSLAPGFNMGNFLSKMRKLQEQGLIEFCSDDSSAEGIKIYVGFKDSSVLKDRVLPELHTSQSYQFYVVKRDEDGAELSDETLFAGGLFRMFDEFIDFRRTVEEARLQRELKLAKAQLLKFRAVLAAIQQIDVVYEVLKTHKTLDSMRTALAEGLGVSEAQAQIVLDMKVHQLARMNEDVQEKKISDVRAHIQELKKDLGNIDGVIVRHLKALLRFSDARGTVRGADVETPDISMPETKTFVMAQGTKLVRLSGEPSRRNKFDRITYGTSAIAAVYQDNSAEILATSFLTEYSSPQPLAGLISDASSLIVVLDDGGKSAVIKNPPGKKTKFNCIKGATKIVSAVGVAEGGSLVAVTKKGKGARIPHSGLHGTRAFVKGFKLPVDTTRTDSVVRLLSLPPGAHLYNGRAQKLTGSSFSAKGALWAIGERNFVSVKNGKRDIVNHEEATRLLKRGELAGCWILT